uniref:Uncharacterized protein n=1 Tax=Anguilla anguilla TaxID=7936 RepID=A0A0E9SVB6_ANGAN
MSLSVFLVSPQGHSLCKTCPAFPQIVSLHAH